MFRHDIRSPVPLGQLVSEPWADFADSFISLEDQSVYTKALASGSIPVNRYRLMVVGKDGAGKSCFIDSLLDRPYKPSNPSTDGIAIDVAVTAAEGRKGHKAWAAHEVHEGQYLDQYVAAGYVITRKREENDMYEGAVTTFFEEMELEERKKVNEWEVKVSQDKDAQTEIDTCEKNSIKQRESCDVAELDYIDQITKEEKLTEKQQHMVVDYLESNEALSSLENYEVSTKLLWDLGGQETYLTTHTALMPTESLYTVCAYLLAIDISVPLGEIAKSSFRGNTQSQDLSLKLSSLLYNRDFPRHWFTSICISHPSDVTSPYLGEDLGVKYPPILIGATHMDKVRKMPNFEEFLRTQNEELDKLICDLKCEDHIVRPDDADRWFFSIDNTKSGQGDNPRCESVKAIGSKLDGASMQYWSKKNQMHPMPVAWARFEIFLVTWKMGKIISVKTAIKLAERCKINTEEEALLALKFLHELGVIFYFWTVPGLAERVIVDTRWLISAVGAFVTAKEPKKAKHRRQWRKLTQSGEFSQELISDMLINANVEPKDQGTVLEVLKVLDIICEPPQSELSSQAVMIPCMIQKKLEGPSFWEKYDPTEPFPPPIVVSPRDVQTIPETIFFRLVTRLARIYTENFVLSRDRCVFRLGNSLVLELLYYNRGDCLIASLNADGDPDDAKDAVKDRASATRDFVLTNLDSVKQRGMRGLKLDISYQMAKSVVTQKGNELPINDFLVLENRKHGLDQKCVDLLYRSGGGITKEHRGRIDLWCRLPQFEQESKKTELTETLKRNPTEAELAVLSKHISDVWNYIARLLKVPIAIIREVNANNQNNKRHQAMNMLSKWKDIDSQAATVASLCQALLQEGLKQTAAEVFAIADKDLDDLMKSD